MDGGISRDEYKAYAEREDALKILFSVRQIRDFHSMQFGVDVWDTLAKKVDINSKIGKFIYFFVNFLIKIRKLK